MRKVDIKGGQFTYGQRIELGQILADDSITDIERFFKAMHCLLPDFTAADIERGRRWWIEDVLPGLAYWVEREKKELHREFTQDERLAGAAAVGRRVGYMGTVAALAKEYSIDPDEILKWKYAKVFNILYVDLQNNLYRERYAKLQSDKLKRRR